MSATSTGNQPEYDAQTRAELERYGCDDPYDPRFIYRAVYGWCEEYARRGFR